MTEHGKKYIFPKKKKKKVHCGSKLNADPVLQPTIFIFFLSPGVSYYSLKYWMYYLILFDQGEKPQ